VAFGISGFGASEVAAAPQIFQALSLGGRAPQPPAPPYGTPNANLVPVAAGTPRAFPANLTLAAQASFDALLRIGRQTPLDLSHPALQGALPNTTASLAATNPAVTFQVQGPAAPGVPGLQSAPQGPVSFLVGAPAATAVTITAIARTAASIEAARQSAPAFRAAPAYVPAASPRAVTSIVRTASALAVASVYPSPVFSFHA
jgi:hypothetical protein